MGDVCIFDLPSCSAAAPKPRGARQVTALLEVTPTTIGGGGDGQEDEQSPTAEEVRALLLESASPHLELEVGESQWVEAGCFGLMHLQVAVRYTQQVSSDDSLGSVLEELCALESVQAATVKQLHAEGM